jgi:Ala-tRNA(Pro) deacylase
MTDREKILSRLDELNIEYKLAEHKAAFAMEDYDELGINKNDEICKNLFLRDYKGNRHMLVVLKGSKNADLVLIRNEINSSRLSFASDERMRKHLNVTTGSVSPLGIINDENDAVEVYFDRDLKGAERLGFHPNDNTATVFMSFDGISRYVESTGHRIAFINV